MYNFSCIHGRLSSCSTPRRSLLVHIRCTFNKSNDSVQLTSHSAIYEPIPRLTSPFHDLRTHDRFFAAQACFFRFLNGSGLVISPCVSYSTPPLAFLFNDCTHQILCQDRNPDRSRVFTSLFLVSRAVDGF